MAYYFPTDRFHDESVRWIDATVDSDIPIYAPSLLLPEAAGALMRRSQRPRLVLRALTGIDALPQVQFRSVDGSLAMRAVGLAIEYRLAGADAVYLALAEVFDVPFVTWDAEALQRAGPRATTPVEAG